MAEQNLFEFEPIKGYPMLHWQGKRPYRSTQYYPAQEKERFGSEVEGWRNEIYWGDNLQVMSHLLKKYRGKINLIYIDPPFDSKADYKKMITLKGKSIENDYNTFEEKQYGDIWTNDEYLQFMYERLIVMRELLSEDGSIYLHCDWNKGHYLKILLDEVFGVSNFQNHIVWKRSTPRGNAYGRFPELTDFILFYTKSEQRIWNNQFTEYTEEYINKYYNQVDKKTGKKYQPTSLLGFMGVNPVREWKGMKKPWRYPIHRLDELDSKGLIYWPENGGMPRYKRFLEEQKGIPVQSLWDDIYPVNSQAEEDTTYPTQKPETLMERIVRASSNPGDIVFDCFMGSGTTQAVAMKLGRKFIGADINLGAVQTTTKRLIQVTNELEEKQNDLLKEDEIKTYYTGFSVFNVNDYDVFRNPVEAKELLMESLEINPFPGNSIYDGEKDGRMVAVMPINRISTKADLNKIITGMDLKTFEKRQKQKPGEPVEKITLICMGHEPDLKAHLVQELKPYNVDVEVVDILRDRQDLRFKRDSEAEITVEKGRLTIKHFYPLNLLQKLSIMDMKNWKTLVDSIMIDWNYDGVVMEPKLVDVPENDEFVKGEYPVPKDAGTIRVKITDLLSESLEVEVKRG